MTQTFNPADHPAMFTDRLVLPVLQGGCVVKERSGYDVILCEQRPGYWFGSLLALAHPPQLNELPAWWTCWVDELGGHLTLKRAILQREAPISVPPPTGQGFEALESSTALVLGELEAQPNAVKVSVVGELWEEVTEMVAGALGLSAAPDGFLAWRYREWRRLVDLGLGQWFVVRREGRVVCSGGVFFRDGVARLQEIVTAPGFRRSGLATALVSALGEYARGNQVVVVAETGSGAQRLYEGLGFVPKTRQFAILKVPRELPK